MQWVEGRMKQRGKHWVAKEQKREYEKVLKSVLSPSSMNENYLDNISEVSEILKQLAIDVKHTVKEKEIIE